MISNKKRLLIYSIPFFILFSLIIFVPILASPYPPIKPSPIPFGDYAYAIAYTEYRIQKMMEKYNLPCVAVSIVDDQKTIWSNVTGISNEFYNRPATSETIFRIGSISKVFTALEIMLLNEQGLINLDSPITDYLPDFSIKSHFNTTVPITIRHILAHRSGLPRNDNLLPWYWDPGSDHVLEEVVKSVQESYAAYPAGSRYKYSNLGYDVLGRIIEIIRGKWFPIALQEDFFDPLKMESTAYKSELLHSISDIAVGYYPEKRKNIAYNQYDIINLASGNLYSTIGDLSKFMKWVFRGGEQNSVPLLEKVTLSKMFVDQYSRPQDPQANGLGFFTDRSYFGGKLLIFHDGDIDGTQSSILMLPEQKLGLVLISNSDSFTQENKQFAYELLAILLETKYGDKSSEDHVIEPISLDSATLFQYTGTYVIHDTLSTIYTQQNKLKGKIYGLTVRMMPLDESSFKIQHWFLDVGNIEVNFYEDYLILSIEGIDHKFCPKYPEYDEVPEDWTKFIGTYEVLPRRGSIYTEEWAFFTDEIKEEKKVLQFRDAGLFLKSLNSTELIILGGPFDGETIIRDPMSGDIFWQHLRYKPITVI